MLPNALIFLQELFKPCLISRPCFRLSPRQWYHGADVQRPAEQNALPVGNEDTEQGFLTPDLDHIETDLVRAQVAGVLRHLGARNL